MRLFQKRLIARPWQSAML